MRFVLSPRSLMILSTPPPTKKLNQLDLMYKKTKIIGNVIRELFRKNCNTHAHQYAGKLTWEHSRSKSSTVRVLVRTMYGCITFVFTEPRASYPYPSVEGLMEKLELWKRHQNTFLKFYVERSVNKLTYHFGYSSSSILVTCLLQN